LSRLTVAQERESNSQQNTTKVGFVSYKMNFLFVKSLFILARAALPHVNNVYD